MSMEVTLLGTGSSSGVPEIGCDCAVCRSDNPKNTRSRVSVLVKKGDTTLLIDTSPDLRTQALRAGIKRLDGVLYTHEHYDHVGGIDDLRQINVRMDRAIDVYAEKRTLKSLQERFDYAFLPVPERAWYRPALTAHEIKSDPLEPFTVAGIEIHPFEQQHGNITSLGFRIGDFAYSTDVNGFSETSFKALEGLDTWVVDCLRYGPSYTHSKLDMTLEWVERVKPKRTILTHMAHEFEYETLKSELPDGVEPGYDGLVIQFD